MVTIYGADWCEDTRRSLRHLRRLGVSHQYLNIDEDLDALDTAKALNGGRRRTPIIDLGLGGAPLVEPDNDALTGALIERDMLSNDTAADRLAVQNVGDFERVLRTVVGAGLLMSSRTAPRGLRGALAVAGAIVGLSGIAGWCPVYHAARVTSLDGPGDRPDESLREAWLSPRRSHPVDPELAAPGTA